MCVRDGDTNRYHINASAYLKDKVVLHERRFALEGKGGVLGLGLHDGEDGVAPSCAVWVVDLHHSLAHACGVVWVVAVPDGQRLQQAARSVVGGCGRCVPALAQRNARLVTAWSGGIDCRFYRRGKQTECTVQHKGQVSMAVCGTNQPQSGTHQCWRSCTGLQGLNTNLYCSRKTQRDMVCDVEALTRAIHIIIPCQRRRWLAKGKTCRCQSMSH